MKKTQQFMTNMDTKGGHLLQRLCRLPARETELRHQEPQKARRAFLGENTPISSLNGLEGRRNESRRAGAVFVGDPPEVPLLLTLLEKFMHWWGSKNTPQNWYFGGCFFLFLILEAYRSESKIA